MKSNLYEILPGIFTGNYNSFEIKSIILNLSGESLELNFDLPKNTTTYNFNLNVKWNLSKNITKILNILREANNYAIDILIYDNNKEMSSSILVIYLIKYYCYSIIDAIDFVICRFPGALYNKRNLKFLSEFQHYSRENDKSIQSRSKLSPPSEPAMLLADSFS